MDKQLLTNTKKVKPCLNNIKIEKFNILLTNNSVEQVY